MQKPNILFLMCDQLQAMVLDPNHPCKTPNFDYLASKGIRFERAYTPNAVCSPARASLMTGLLPHNHGVLFVTHLVDPDQGCLRVDKPHWAQQLQKVGYRTGYFGKWHIERSYRLEDFGWRVNCMSDNGGSPLFKEKKRKILGGKAPEQGLKMARYLETPEGYSKGLLYGVTDLEPEKRSMGIITTMALEYLDEVLQGDQPWCCFVSVPEPHDPFVCSREAYELYDVNSLELPANFNDELEGRPGLYKKASSIFRDLTDGEKKEAMACYYGSITEIDQQFGRLVQRIKDAGKLEDTIVVLTTDHGELLGAHGMYCKNISAGEEVYNIPLIMAGPGVAEGVVSKARVGLHDLCPTLLEMVGLKPFNVPDSRSFASVLSDPENEGGNYTTGFAEYHGGRILLTQRVIWDGPWKFVFNGFDFDELYNLDDDPFEMNNLANNPEYIGVVRRMLAQMWRKVRDTNDHSLYNSHYPILRVAPFGPLTADQ